MECGHVAAVADGVFVAVVLGGGCGRLIAMSTMTAAATAARTVKLPGKSRSLRFMCLDVVGR